VLFPDSEIERLQAALARPSGGYATASFPTRVTPLELVRAGSSLFRVANYFSSPDGSEIAGLGAAWRAGAAGSERFARLDAAIAALPDLAVPVRCFLGFSFSPDGPRQAEWEGFGAADLTIPEVGVERRGDDTRLTVVVPPGADPGVVLGALAGLEPRGVPLPPDPGDHSVESHPSTAHWREEVAEAVAAIGEGSLRKVVLSRSVIVRSESATDPFELVHHLRASHPQCYSFGFQVGGSVFVGASPELLLSKRGDRVRVNPLAGSARRGEGEEDDRAVGEALLASEKDREEHAFVVDDIVGRLAPLSEALEVPPVPSLRRMATVQHLSTDIDGTLREGVGPFRLLATLHPTPAVGGTPRSEARAFIDKVEGIDRGWYSGGVGWVSPGGSAEVALSLRCGLVTDTTARLYAGAGIVAESDPDAELDETRLKFRPLLNLLAVT
jgi:salicylate biosynthesis isochorismate synthase